MASGSRLRTVAARRFGIDTRGLAALRISLGLLLLVDLLLRSRHLVAFYTDAGVLPRSTLYSLYPGARFAPHAMSGAAWFEALLFVIAGGFALSLLVGYRTRFATVMSLVLLASLHARNPLVLNGGDTLLRRLLFWSVFLPLAERWSVASPPENAARGRVVSVASAALLIQVVVVYVASVVFKLRGDLWVDGSALLYLYQLDQLTVFLGDSLAGFPAALEALGWVWLLMLASSGLLLLATGRARTLLVVLFASMHVGMAASLQIGLFPFISIAALLPFLPRSCWDTLGAHGSGAIAWFEAQLPYDRALGGMRKEEPNPSTTGNSKGASLSSVVVGVLLAGTIVWNGMTIGLVPTPDPIASVRDPTEHRWDMFARGERDEGWFVAPGRLVSGERIDALQRSSFSWDRPPDLAGTFPSSRWLRYSIAMRGDPQLQRHLAEYLCWRWNRGHVDELVDLRIYHVKRPVDLGMQTSFRRVELLQYSCPGRATASKLEHVDPPGVGGRPEPRLRRVYPPPEPDFG